MNFKYLFIAIIFIPSVICTMDYVKEPTPRRRTSTPSTPKNKHQLNTNEAHTKHSTTIEKRSFIKVSPVIQIFSMKTAITFNKKTLSIFEWLCDHKSSFEKTPIIGMMDDIQFVDAPARITLLGHLHSCRNNEAILTRIADQASLFISGTSRYYTSQSKYITYGTLLILQNYVDIGESANQNYTQRALNRFFMWLTIADNRKLVEPKGIQ